MGLFSTPAIGNGTNTGLTDIVEDIYGKSEKVTLKDVQEFISQFTKFGEVFQKEQDLKKMAESLSDIANKAKSYTLSETDDWFDKVTVNRNMKELNNLSKQFGKIVFKNQIHYNKEWVDYTKIWAMYYLVILKLRMDEDSMKDDEQEDAMVLGLKNVKGSDIEEGDYKIVLSKSDEKIWN